MLFVRIPLNPVVVPSNFTLWKRRNLVRNPAGVQLMIETLSLEKPDPLSMVSHPYDVMGFGVAPPILCSPAFRKILQLLALLAFCV